MAHYRVAGPIICHSGIYTGAIAPAGVRKLTVSIRCERYAISLMCINRYKRMHLKDHAG